MKNATKFVLIAAILMIAVFAIPVTGAESACIVPPDSYFTSYSNGVSAASIGASGLDGYQVWLTADGFGVITLPSQYLGLNGSTYKLQISHNYQEMIAFKRMVYCMSVSDYPYKPRPTITSEDPTTSVYLTTQELRAKSSA